MALSITEAEYIAVCEGAKDSAWICQVMKELLPSPSPHMLPPSLYMDNEAAQKISKNHSYYRRTRHIEHRYHYLRQEATNRNLIVIGIEGKHQLADLLTKIVAAPALSEWKKKVGVLGTR